ncbi:lysylphosphatidylglycerol synthase domain-containing protein [Pseudonocardia benzenivorans]|uniref:Lysylphosphatidylglycerol synthase domain-containing protein n=1 Tax=Pseudonocardia benzenivorans TaxID=228005 RepID=A0ABW3VQZ3_9PSEU
MLSLLTAVVVVVLGVPAVTGVNWSAVGERLAGLPAPAVLELIVLWLLGLWSYTFVLTASLPGLTHTQAFTLNAVGSAVSNLLPFGGTAGVATTFAMTGAWGLRPKAVAASTLVTGIWNSLGRLALPAVGLGLLAVSGHISDPRLTAAAAGASGVLLAGLLVAVAALRVGAVADLLARVLPRAWRPRRGRAGQLLLGLRHATVDLVSRRWGRLSVAIAVYLGLQALLLAVCLGVAGAHVSPVEMLAPFALGRVLTMVVVLLGVLAAAVTAVSVS